MNTIDRKYILIAITFFVTLCALIGGIALWKYVTSFHKVTFAVQPASLTADIYKIDLNEGEHGEGKKVQSIKDSQQVSLQTGKYYAVPQDKKYDQSEIAFDVNDTDTTVKLTPPFSEQYLSNLLKKELPAIQKAILVKYPSASTAFTLMEGKLYTDGTWYGTHLIQHNDDPGGEQGDTYSAVLHKQNGVWQFAAIPKIVLTAPDNPSIPKAVLDDLSTQE